MEVLEDFAKAKDLPTVGRVSGGGARRVYYEHPEQVQVIEGRNVPYQAVGRLAAEAERRGMTPNELADELFPEPEPQPSLPARVGKTITEALRIG
jgi:hypothetical protein